MNFVHYAIVSYHRPNAQKTLNALKEYGIRPTVYLNSADDLGTYDLGDEADIIFRGGPERGI